MDDAVVKLEADYCPPLDPALLSAIVSDYDLTTEEGLGTARATLDQLKESALIEEAAGSFDPSGTGGHESEDVARKMASCPETGDETSTETSTDLTSLSQGLSALDLREWEIHEDDGKEVGTAEDLEKLDEDTKIMLLQELFGKHVSRYSIQHTLRKCNGKWNSTMEELLNHVYFGEAEDSEDGSKVPAKGIEGFSEGNGVGRRGRKGKAKGRKFKSLDEARATSLPSSPDGSRSPAFNKWQTAEKDVDFIATRTGISSATVKSTYNEQRSSVPQTINALVKQTMEETKKVVTDDETVARHARELGHDFPTIAPHYLAALIRLTHPSTSDAHELAKALTARPKDPSGGGGIQIIPNYIRPDAADLDPSSTTNGHNKCRSASPSPAAVSRAGSYAAARAQAFSQASAAHRKAKSDRLMGGAAAYYSQLGRDYSALNASSTARAADSLANSQCTATSLDLHGIDVLNGVRIAREKTEAWWERLGESRVNGRVGAGDRSTGFNIVVGKGTHSEGGKGKLGPAVMKALRGDGWRVEGAGAVVVVKGRQR